MADVSNWFTREHRGSCLQSLVAICCTACGVQGKANFKKSCNILECKYNHIKLMLNINRHYCHFTKKTEINKNEKTWHYSWKGWLFLVKLLVEVWIKSLMNAGCAFLSMGTKYNNRPYPPPNTKHMQSDQNMLHNPALSQCNYTAFKCC